LIAFFENVGRHGRITVIDQTGTKRVQSEQLQSIGGRLAWRPDGKEVWFSRLTGAGTETIRALDLSGRERTVLRSPDWNCSTSAATAGCSWSTGTP